MKKILLLLMISVCLLPNCVSAKDDVKPEFKKYFDGYDVKGTFVLYDSSNKKFTRYNPERAKQQFTPASTFKILNSLIGLETGEISGEDYIFKWSGQKYGNENWNQDLVLRDAFQFSCLPCYQDLARRIGEPRMRKWVEKVGYGNKNISGGIDRFWIADTLRISPNEQVNLLRKLYKNKLPFSNENQELVKKIMLVEDNSKYKLYTKTGLMTFENKKIGWYVGFIEQNENVYFFATNIETNTDDENFIPARIEITKQILKELKLL